MVRSLLPGRKPSAPRMQFSPGRANASGTPPRAVEQRRFTLQTYETPESLFELLAAPQHGETAPVRLLDGQWLRTRASSVRVAAGDARRGLAPPRRQDLEATQPDAFMSAEVLASLSLGDARIGSPLPIIAVSHMWKNRHHTDPETDNLLALDQAFEEQREAGRFPSGRFAVVRGKGLDQSFSCAKLARVSPSLALSPPHSIVRPPARPNFAVSGLVLAAAARRSRQSHSPRGAGFQTALSSVHLWFAHSKTLVYMLTQTPASWGSGHVPYHDRAWPLFQQRVSMFSKVQSKKCWANLFDSSGLAKPLMLPPLTPERFAALLQPKALANEADRELIVRLYRDALNTALGMSTQLRFGQSSCWGDREMEQLCEVLPRCTQIVRLNLKCRESSYTLRGAALLAELVSTGAMPFLREIGARCTAKSSPDPGVLLESNALREVCEQRGIHLARDNASSSAGSAGASTQISSQITQHSDGLDRGKANSMESATKPSLLTHVSGISSSSLSDSAEDTAAWSSFVPRVALLQLNDSRSSTSSIMSAQESHEDNLSSITPVCVIFADASGFTANGGQWGDVRVSRGMGHHC
jgi:hypothetical protein